MSGRITRVTCCLFASVVRLEVLEGGSVRPGVRRRRRLDPAADAHTRFKSSGRVGPYTTIFSRFKVLKLPEQPYFAGPAVSTLLADLWRCPCPRLRPWRRAKYGFVAKKVYLVSLERAWFGRETVLSPCVLPRCINPQRAQRGPAVQREDGTAPCSSPDQRCTAAASQVRATMRPARRFRCAQHPPKQS
jgi:hypothetical protein